MSLDVLQIQNLRNIKSARFQLHPRLNLIIGPNGSGKTSFLEAIYLLGSGHSFRTREISPLVSTETDCLTVFARTQDEQPISIQKSISTLPQARINGQPCKTSSELAYFLPCQVFYQDLFQIMDAGPSTRRSLLDWGMFHVKHSYHLILKDYKRALKQRNNLLRQKIGEKYFEPWNIIIEELATKLDDYRSSYFIELEKEFKKILPQLSDLDCSLAYYKGWDRKECNKSLAKILAENYHSDLQRQFTQYGPHQADILIGSNNLKAKQFLSRGQQKIILIALKFAQTILMEKHCIYLCDDFASELDAFHLERLSTMISNINGQFFITATHQSPFPLNPRLSDHKLFLMDECFT